MALAAAFLGGARSRLLPAHVPFRFFGAAVTFHVLAWLALLAGAAQLPHFAGGLAWPLAALHLATLGVLVMTAIGASLQLLPVATRQPLHGARAPALLWWLYTPGVALLTLGMGLARPPLLGLGAVALVVALLVYAALLGRNLQGARGMPAVVAHGWAALGSLVVVLGSALALVGNYLGWPSLDRSTTLALHLAFAVYGFMGLLSLGLSYILVPMFALSTAPDVRPALASLAAALAALALAAAGAFGFAPMPTQAAAAALGLLAVALHLRLMHKALREGMRRELGPSFVLVRIAWVSLVLSLFAALALALRVPWPALPRLFVLLLIDGWLLSFLFGMLQRILPFLASMHVAGSKRRAPTPSSLTAAKPLALHFHCHWVALVVLALAIAVDSSVLALIGAAIGALGALGFGVFFVTLMRRMVAAGPSATPPVVPPAAAPGT